MSSPDQVCATASVAVVIPCHNLGRYLADALRSVMSQSVRAEQRLSSSMTVRPTEPPQWPDHWRRECGTSFRNGAGLSAARILGVRVTVSDYLLFLDADDVVLPVAIEAGTSALNENQNCGFAVGLYEEVDDELRPIGTRASGGHRLDLYESLLRENCIGACHSVMFRRRALGDDPFDTTLTACEDYDLYLRLSRNYWAVFHDETVAAYRQRADSMSREAGRMLRNVVTVLKRQRSRLRGHEERVALQDGLRWGREATGPLCWRSFVHFEDEG